jgi:N-acetylglucosaminyl-diphospho-decaprenol L-rhamnosyltransferase
VVGHDDGLDPSDVVVTAVVVSWNTRELLRQCLGSLEAAAATLPMQIVVVDNASADGSADMVAVDFPAVQLLRNAHNVGFARANNRAFKCARGRYLLVFNPDARFDAPTTLSRWVALMEQDTEIAASGAYIVDGDGRHRLGDAGFRPSLRSMLGLYWFLARVSPRWFPPFFLYANGGTSVDVDWVSGAALLVRGSRLAELGAFDERVFMYGEDVEWCCRMRDHGYRVVHLPSIRVTHLEGASTRQRSGARFSTLWFRQLRTLYFHYQPRQPAWVFDVVLLAGLIVRALGYTVVAVVRGGGFARGRIAQHLACIGFLCRQFGRRGLPWSAQLGDEQGWAE